MSAAITMAKFICFFHRYLTKVSEKNYNECDMGGKNDLLLLRKESKLVIVSYTAILRSLGPFSRGKNYPILVERIVVIRKKLMSTFSIEHSYISQYFYS